MTAIVAVVPGEPFDSHTWSGCSPYFLNALDRAGLLRAALGATVGTIEHRVLTLLMAYPNVDRWRFRIGVNTLRRQMITRRGIAQLARIHAGSYDTILQVGAFYDFTGIPGKRTISYHDTNLKTLARSLPAADPRSAVIRAALTYEARVYARAQLIFTMSRWAADTFVRDLGIDARKVEPVGAGINVDAAPSLDGKRYDEPNILFVGIEFARKGGLVLLAAFERVRREIPKATLTIIGPPVRAEAPPGVEYLGFLSKREEDKGERLVAAYRRAAVFALPSTVEPFGIAFLEAQSFGLPCIGTTFGAMPEIIREADAGYVVPPNDSGALADALIALLRDPSACAQMGKNGYERRRSYYTWDGVVARMAARLGATSSNS